MAPGTPMAPVVPLTHLWLPIIVSAVCVFLVSSIIHMALKFWHASDYKGLPNEDEIGAAIRSGSPAPGMYVLPHCRMEDMKKPEVRAKYDSGPVAYLIVRPNGVPNMGKYMVEWFVYCLIVSIFAAYLGSLSLGVGAPAIQVMRSVATAAFMAFGLAALPNAIWWGQPWSSTVKALIDGGIYALVTGVVFIWMWPH